MATFAHVRLKTWRKIPLYFGGGDLSAYTGLDFRKPLKIDLNVENARANVGARVPFSYEQRSLFATDIEKANDLLLKRVQ